LHSDNPMFRALGGDRASIQRLLGKFLEEFQKNLMEWEMALEQGDSGRLFEIQHRWLSGFRTLGYEELSRKMYAIQQQLLEFPGDLEQVKNLREELVAIREEIGFEKGQLDAQ